jgi:hypothetical protein
VLWRCIQRDFLGGARRPQAPCMDQKMMQISEQLQQSVRTALDWAVGHPLRGRIWFVWSVLVNCACVSAWRRMAAHGGAMAVHPAWAVHLNHAATRQLPGRDLVSVPCSRTPASSLPVARQAATTQLPCSYHAAPTPAPCSLTPARSLPAAATIQRPCSFHAATIQLPCSSLNTRWKALGERQAPTPCSCLPRARSRPPDRSRPSAMSPILGTLASRKCLCRRRVR